MTEDHSAGAWPRSFWRAFACWWLLFCAFGTAWALATPIGASPDAPSQVARAVSVARGQWLGPAAAGPSKQITTYVTVPLTYLDPGVLPHCYMFKEGETAACAPGPRQSSRLVQTETHVGRYPPLYYALVGWPSRFTDAVAGIYLMQVTSAVLCAAFLAAAMAVARKWSSSNWLAIAIGAAATPMCLWLSGQVNPSGLEVASAIAVWTSASVLVAEHLQRPPAGLLAALAISLALMVWTRPTALVWPLVVAAVLAPLAWGRLRRPVVLSPRVTLPALLALSAAGGAAAWAVLAHATAIGPDFVPLPRSSSLGHVVSFVIGRLPSLVQQGVGNFGWLDTPLPWWLAGAWALLAVAVVAVATVSASKDALCSLALAALACFAVPVALLVVVAHRYGYVGQGRYFLAVWAGLPVVAGAVLSPRGRHGGTGLPRLKALVATGAGGGQLFAFYWALRRYTVGIPGPLFWSGAPGARTTGGQLQWRPPVPAWWLFGAFAALSLLYAASLARTSLRHWSFGGPLGGGQAHGIKSDAGTALAPPPAVPAQG